MFVSIKFQIKDSLKQILVKDSSSAPKDTVYGIKSEAPIPYRKAPAALDSEHTTEKQIEKVLYEPTEHKVNVDIWQTALLLVSIFLIAFIKAFNNSRFTQTVKSLFSYSVSLEITREEKVFFHRVNLFLSLNYLICASLFIYSFFPLPGLKSTFNNYLLLVLGIVFIYVVKYLFAKILFFIFNDASISLEYIFNVSLFNNLLGVFLIPTLSFMYFSSINTVLIIKYLALPTVAILFILRMVRLFVLGGNKGVSYLYIFLYICTLEILPLVVLYRFFILK